ncbi:hypothetical protein Tcan_00995, partial [Toxocara canis]
SSLRSTDETLSSVRCCCATALTITLLFTRFTNSLFEKHIMTTLCLHICVSIYMSMFQSDCFNSEETIAFCRQLQKNSSTRKRSYSLERSKELHAIYGQLGCISTSGVNEEENLFKRSIRTTLEFLLFP